MNRAEKLYDITEQYYQKAIAHERGQKILATAKEDLGVCVYNICIGDELVVNFVFEDGEFHISKGRGEPREDGYYIEASISEDDFFELLEGRIGFTESTANGTIRMVTVGVIWDFKTRPFVSIWGSLTRIGQDITTDEKIKCTDLYKF